MVDGREHALSNRARHVEVLVECLTPQCPDQTDLAGQPSNHSEIGGLTVELLPACLDFLSAAFFECGLPLEIYLHYHGIFFTQDPHAPTQLGQGKDNLILFPVSADRVGEVSSKIRMRERLGGLLKSDFREAA
jgi:hypothetical protein